MKEQEGCKVRREVWAAARRQAEEHTPRKRASGGRKRKSVKRLGTPQAGRGAGEGGVRAQGENSEQSGLRDQVHRDQQVVSELPRWRPGGSGV